MSTKTATIATTKVEGEQRVAEVIHNSEMDGLSVSPVGLWDAQEYVAGHIDSMSWWLARADAMASTEFVDLYLDPETGLLRNKVGAQILGDRRRSSLARICGVSWLGGLGSREFATELIETEASPDAEGACVSVLVACSGKDFQETG